MMVEMSFVRSLLPVALLVAIATAAAAMVEDAPAPPRLRWAEGDAWFWRPGMEGWEAAQANIPLAVGDALATREGRVEVQIGVRSFVRAGAGTRMLLVGEDRDRVRFEVGAGSVVIDLRDVTAGVGIDTPNGAVAAGADGYYRVDVDAESTRVAVRRGGSATASPANGRPLEVASGEALEFSEDVVVADAGFFDDWDRWNYDRGGAFAAAGRTAAVSSEVYGVEELEEYGDWVGTETYGSVWVPSVVPSGWSPYSDGRWLWDRSYGWSWVDAAPWGWAPFHYGRWVHTSGWAWAPGPPPAVAEYSPALVVFLGRPEVGQPWPFVSWVPLGWGEPLLPWWGGPGFIGVPCWRGWGGPRKAHRGAIARGDAAQVNTTRAFRNARVAGAVVGTARDRFGARGIKPIRLSAVTGKEAKSLHAAMPGADRAGGQETAKKPVGAIRTAGSRLAPLLSGAPAGIVRPRQAGTPVRLVVRRGSQPVLPGAVPGRAAAVREAAGGKSGGGQMFSSGRPLVPPPGGGGAPAPRAVSPGRGPSRAVVGGVAAPVGAVRPARVVSRTAGGAPRAAGSNRRAVVSVVAGGGGRSGR